jgi:hypothetical protein
MAVWCVCKMCVSQYDTAGFMHSPAYVKKIFELTWGLKQSSLAPVLQYDSGHSSHVLAKALDVDIPPFFHNL